MGLLAYWVFDNYKSDTSSGFNYHYDSAQERLHTATSVGDDVFLVTYAPIDERKEYVLLAHLIIASKALNEKNYPYGEYRIWADRQRSRYFALDNPPLTPVLAELNGITHYSNTDLKKYAASCQQLRKLDVHDTFVLRRFARRLVPHQHS